jgi:hypothetical protein
VNHRCAHPGPAGNTSEFSELIPVAFPLLPYRSGQRPNGTDPVRRGNLLPAAILAAGRLGTSLRRDVSVVSRPVASSATGLNQAPFQSTRACSPSRPWQKSPRPMWAIDPVSPVEQVHPKLQNRQGRTSPRLSVVLLEPRNCVPNWGASHG